MKRTSKSIPKGTITDEQLERELRKLHDQMSESVARLEQLLEGVADEHRAMARAHLRRFHSEQKRHLEHIRRKLYE